MYYDVYTDGSYKDYGSLGAFYSGAATINPVGEPDRIAILTKVSNDELIAMRNVAGEIIAAMMAFEHCLNVLKLKQEDTVVMHYDYVGIENWTKRKGEPGYWRSKNKTTQAYRNYVNSIVKPRFRIEWKHTPGHTGDPGNERVDYLAGIAIEQHVKELMEHK